MRACLNNWRGSPRRFNEYLRAVRGLYALDAVNKLKFMPSPYAHALRALISSAIANATSDPSKLPNNLKIFEATVGRATFLKRVCFRGRGRTGKVTKFSSNVRVILKDEAEMVSKKASSIKSMKSDKIDESIVDAPKKSVSKKITKKESNNG
jgi:large subunit ribosomal protein L22